MVAAVKVVVGKTPDVKGASATAVAPVKAGACDAAAPSGNASVAAGFNTLFEGVSGVERRGFRWAKMNLLVENVDHTIACDDVGHDNFG